MINIKTTFKNKDAVLKSFGFGEGSPIQLLLDSMVIKKCEPYIPKKTGALIKSAVPLFGSVMWSMVYAKKQYYTHKGNGLRGPFWVERMWNDANGEILDGIRGAMDDNRRRN